MIKIAKKKWFPFSHLNETKQVNTHKLFCFHHAGGTAAAFKNWVRNQQNVAIYSVELPGKATRIRENFSTHYQELVPEIAETIENEVGESSFSLFGHSMGAVLAFKIAYFLETELMRKPNRLIVAGRHAPQEEYKDPYQTYMGDDKLIEELKRVNGTPKEILENEALLNFLLPSIKNDYKLNESFDYKNEVLSIPITAHVSDQDPDANFSQMQKWKQVTNRDFEIKEYSGDHFFIYKLGKTYYEEVAKIATLSKEYPMGTINNKESLNFFPKNAL